MVGEPSREPLDAAYYQRERYLGDGSRPRHLAAYYALKPVIPRGVQLGLRRAYASRQARARFPAWPIEPILLHRQHDEIRARLRESGAGRVPLVNFWPDRRRFAVVLTHDVEGPRGVANIPRVLEAERRYGFVSSWNFVAEDYEIPAGTFERIRAAGGEIGLHGISHDGKLFQSRARFDADLPKIRAYLERWGAVGFRSPATHRNADWMHELGCLYDSSFPDTDPFEPQPGGCCSIFPFFLGDVVELPITLVQDHTLFEILRERSIDAWKRKSEWIMRNHGLINLITHPDYLVAPERLALYEAYLEFLAAKGDAWHALPRDVALWWKEHTKMRCEAAGGGQARVVGAMDERATVAWARESDGQVVFET